MASDCDGMVAIGDGLRVRNQECADSELDPEVVYEQLLSHAWECRICWPWRNQLWAVHRFCPTGAALADRYAVAVARMGGRQ